MASILIVSPHADDEIIGCGGMIAKSEADIDLVVVTIGNPRDGVQAPIGARKAELEASCRALGVRDWQVLYYGLSGFLDTLEMFDLVGRLESIISAGRYDEVYYPLPCHMHDHEIVNRACWAALRPGAHEYPPRLVAMYEHTWPGWSRGYSMGKMYVDISETIERKLAALECYQSQLQRHRPGHPISGEAVGVLATARGMEVGLAHAELYYIVQMRR
jgi:LmbE family N-acetylglucosaminyl deacetylase